MIFEQNSNLKARSFQEGKLAILTEHKLILSYLSNLEFNLTAILVYKSPLNLQYDKRRQQMLIQSKSAIEIYFSDWQEEIELLRILSLNQQSVYSITSQENQWNVFGQMYQYSDSNFRMFRVEQSQNAKSWMCKCFIGQTQVCISANDKKLYLINHKSYKKPILQIKGQFADQASRYIESTEFQAQNFMNGVEGQNGTILLSLNQRLILIVSIEEAVSIQAVLLESKIILMQNSLIITQKRNAFKVTYSQTEYIVCLSQLNQTQGAILSVAQQSDQLSLTLFKDQQLKVVRIGVNEQKKYIHSKKLLYLSETVNFNQLKFTQNTLQNQSKTNLNRLQQQGGNQLFDQDVVYSQLRITEAQQVIEIEQIIDLQNFSIDRMGKISNLQQRKGSSQQVQDSLEERKEQQDKEIPDSPFNSACICPNYGQNSKCAQFDQDFLNARVQIQVQEEGQLFDSKEFICINKGQVGKDRSDIKSSKIKFSQKGQIAPSMHHEDKTIQLAQQVQKDLQQNKDLLGVLNLNFLKDVKQDQHIFYSDDHKDPMTPGFNAQQENFRQQINTHQQSNLLQNNQDDKWKKFTNQWQSKSPFSQEPQNLTSEFCPGNVQNQQNSLKQKKYSRKVMAFSRGMQSLTEEKAQQIEKKKYTLLMREVFVKSQQLFNQLMKQFLQQIIREQEARLFFAEYIRTFSGKTRDILVRLYMSIPQNQQNKFYMSIALSEFKLNQVPQSCLIISKQIISIFQVLYSSVYVEDLLNQSENLIRLLMQNYFKNSQFSQEQLLIQDEQIDITLPRNILNVLLYLNQSYNLPIIKIFQIYCEELIKNGCVDIILKIIQQEDTFQICQIPRTILEDIVQNNAIQKLKQSFTFLQQIQDSLCLLSNKKKEEFLIVLNIIDFLNLNDLYFSVQNLFKLLYNKNIFIFCNTLIRQNATHKLQSIRIQELYVELYMLVNKQRPLYYTQELKDLCQILIQKYFQNGLYREAFHYLSPIISVTKKGFLAKMLVKHLEGKMLYKLIGLTFDKQLFQKEFMHFFEQSHSTNLVDIPKQTVKVKQQSQYYQCSKQVFRRIYKSCISNRSRQIEQICFQDYYLGCQLSTYQIINKEQWKQFYLQIKQYIPANYIKKEIKQMLVFDSRIRIQDQHQQDFNCQKQKISDSGQIQLDFFKSILHNQRTKPMLTKSLQAMNYNDSCDPALLKHYHKPVQRSKSDPYIQQQTQKQSDILLQSLKTQVDHQSISHILKQIYTSPGFNLTRFIKALSLIDRERFIIYHYQSLKILSALNLQFDLRALFPFQTFLSNSFDWCFKGIEDKLELVLSLKNFWAFYIIVEILIERGELVAIMMIQKIMQEKDDSLSFLIQLILNKIKISQTQLSKLAEKASNFRLHQIFKIINSHVQLLTKFFDKDKK